MIASSDAGLGRPDDTVCILPEYLDEALASIVGAASMALAVGLAAWAAARGLGDWMPAAVYRVHVDGATHRRLELAELVVDVERHGVPGVRFTAAVLDYVTTTGELKRRRQARERMRHMRERRRAAAGVRELPFDAGSACAKPVRVTQDVTQDVTQSVTQSGAAPAERLRSRARADQDLQDQDQEHGPSGRRPCETRAHIPASGSLLCALVGLERDADPALQLPTDASRARLYARAASVAEAAGLFAHPEQLSAAIRQVEVARSRAAV